MRTFLALVLGVVLTVCSVAPTYADLSTEVRVGFLGWSQHFGRAANNVSNESHEIIAVEYMGWSAGKFDNSYGRETWFIAKNWRWENINGWKDVNAIASLGVNRGYRECYGNNGTKAMSCVHGYLGVEYDRHNLVHSLKFQPGVILYNPEVKLDFK